MSADELDTAEGDRERINAVSTSDFTVRETEFLAVALKLLQQHGYHRLTVEAVAAEAKASKATLYRRWPSKAELVFAAFIVGTQILAAPPRTGSLRGDLMAVGTLLSQHATEHASTMRAVLNETSIGAELMRNEFNRQRQLLITTVLANAVARGEISAAVINPQICDLLPGYLMFRTVVTGRPLADETVCALIDKVLMPSLTRT